MFAHWRSLDIIKMYFCFKCTLNWLDFSARTHGSRFLTYKLQYKYWEPHSNLLRDIVKHYTILQDPHRVGWKSERRAMFSRSVLYKNDSWVLYENYSDPLMHLLVNFELTVSLWKYHQNFLRCRLSDDVIGNQGSIMYQRYIINNISFIF
jgi:hypothetical protein